VLTRPVRRMHQSKSPSTKVATKQVDEMQQ
jgi:hypothetical protein